MFLINDNIHEWIKGKHVTKCNNELNEYYVIVWPKVEISKW